MRVLIGALVLLLCAWRTHDRSQDWRSDEALWMSAAVSSPALPRPALNLSVVYGRQGDWESSAQWAHRAIDRFASDPDRYGWMRMYLCRHVTRLQVLMPEPPSFSVECVS